LAGSNHTKSHMKIASQVQAAVIRYVVSASSGQSAATRAPTLAPPPNDLVARQVVVEELYKEPRLRNHGLLAAATGLVQRRFGVGGGLALSAALTG
jgi:hypothetical protein